MQCTAHAKKFDPKGRKQPHITPQGSYAGNAVFPHRLRRDEHCQAPEPILLAVELCENRLLLSKSPSLWL